MAPTRLKCFRRKPSHLRTSPTSIQCLTRVCPLQGISRTSTSLIVAPMTSSDMHGTRDRTHRVPNFTPRPFSLSLGALQAARHTAATMHRPARGGKPSVRQTYGFPKFYRRHAQPKPKRAKRIAQLSHLVRRLSSPSQDLTWDHRSAAASLQPVDQPVISKVPECKRSVPSNHSVVSIGTTAYFTRGP